MRHVVVAGAGAALAPAVIHKFLEEDPECRVTAVCRTTRPRLSQHEDYQTHAPRVTVLDGVDLSRGGVKLPEGGQGAGVLATLAPVDVLVTLAGGSEDGRLENVLEGAWHATWSECLLTAAMALKYTLGALQAANGNVVVVGSIVGSTGGYGCGAYAAAKAGLVGLVRAAASENAKHGVCVNLLELGYVDAGMGRRLPEGVKEKVLPTIPLRRFATPAEVAEAVYFLAGVRYATGTVLNLAGGLR